MKTGLWIVFAILSVSSLIGIAVFFDNKGYSNIAVTAGRRVDRVSIGGNDLDTEHVNSLRIRVGRHKVLWVADDKEYSAEIEVAPGNNTLDVGRPLLFVSGDGIRITDAPQVVK